MFQAEQAKVKKLASRQETLKKEIEMREGSEVAQAEHEKAEKEFEELVKLKEREQSSLASVRDDLAFKSTVATQECAKWTDNTLQICQYILND